MGLLWVTNSELARVFTGGLRRLEYRSEVGRKRGVGDGGGWGQVMARDL